MPGRANRQQFSSYLKEQLPDLKLTKDTEDFLFSQFDVNCDGFFESHELMTRTAKEMEATMGRAPSASSVSRQLLRTTSLSSITPQSLSTEELSHLKQRVKHSMGRSKRSSETPAGEAW